MPVWMDGWEETVDDGRLEEDNRRWAAVRIVIDDGLLGYDR